MIDRFFELLKAIDTLFEDDFLRIWPLDGF